MKYNLPRLNAILIAVAFAIVIVGLVLMVGEPSGATEYNPDIYSVRRITVGPMISLLGWVLLVVAIVWKPKKKDE